MTWRAHSGGAHDDAHFRQLAQDLASATDRPPTIKKGVQWTPHRHPSGDEHAFGHDFRPRSQTEGMCDLPDQYAHEQKRDTDGKGNTSIVEDKTQPAPRLLLLVSKVIMYGTLQCRLIDAP